MSYWDTDIIKKTTAEEMVNTYQKVVSLIAEGYELLAQAEQLMKATFGEYTQSVLPKNTYQWHNEPGECAKETELRMRKDAWEYIVNILEIDKVTSRDRYERIQERITSDQSPEITVANIYDILMTLAQNAPEFRQEIIKEAYDILRPRWNHYKTNSEDGVGKKVILTSMVEHKPWGGGFGVRYYKKKDLLTIDKAFHILDGKSMPDSYNGPLCDAIDNSNGEGETDYFDFKCYHNGNLHLTFKRLDLVKVLNASAGKDKLSSDNGAG